MTTTLPNETTDAPKIIDALGRYLSQWRFRDATEKGLQDGLAKAFDRLGLDDVQRGFHLGAAGRLDYLLNGYIGVKVRVGGAPMALQRQATHYLADERVQGLLVVTTRRRHQAVPDTINGKPVGLVILAGA